jgi:hypothetical protein
MTKQADSSTAFDHKGWTRKLDDLKSANRDIGERAQAFIEIEYSPSRDYLYVTLSEAKSNTSTADYLHPDEVYEVVYYDPKSHVIGGFDVPFFLERLETVSARDFWRIVAELVRKRAYERGAAVQRITPTSTEHKKLARALQTLISEAA